MYGAELEDDEDEVEEELRAREVAKVAERPSKPEPSSTSTPSPKSSSESQDSSKGKDESAGIAKESPREGKVDVHAAHDASGAKATGPASPTAAGELPKAAYDATGK